MKRLFITIHDVSPYFLRELKVLFNELDKLKITKYGILITPTWNNEFSIEKNQEFIQLVKSHLKNANIVLHGFNHMSDSKVNGFIGKITGFGSEYLEFNNLSDREIEKKITCGLKLLNETFKVKPIGFVPPMWSFPDNKKWILKKYFKYYSDLFSIDYFNHKIHSVPIAYDGGKNLLISMIIQKMSSLRIRLKKSGVFRFSIHPTDIPQGGLNPMINDLKFLLHNNWKLCLKEEYIE